MKDALRLTTVAALGFALVGGAMLYSSDSSALKGLSARFTGETLEPNQVQSLAGSEEIFQSIEDNLSGSDHNKIWVPRNAQHSWVGLAGFPDSTEMKFPLPSGIRLEGGKLVLNVTSALTNTGDGRLTVLVNGTRRGEIVLNKGRESHNIAVALESSDLINRFVTVQLNARGTTDAGQICPTDASNSGAAITVAENSGLELYTRSDLASVNVAVPTLSDPFTLAVGATREEQAAALFAGQKLSRSGVNFSYSRDGDADVTYVSSLNTAQIVLDDADNIRVDGLSALEQFIQLRTQTLPLSSVIKDGDLPLSIFTEDSYVRTFRGTRRWTIPYTIADFSNGGAPKAVALDVKTTTLNDDAQWIMRVSANGNLLTSERFSGTQTDLHMLVDLPKNLQKLENTLSVELLDVSQNTVVCGRIPDAQAQLLPSSRLIFDSGNVDATGTAGSSDASTAALVDNNSEWLAIVERIATSKGMHLVTETNLDAVDATRLKDMLKLFVPSDIAVQFQTTPFNGRVTLTIHRIEDLQNEPSFIQKGYLIFTNQGSQSDLGLLNLENADAASIIKKMMPSDVAILVTW